MKISLYDQYRRDAELRASSPGARDDKAPLLGWPERTASTPPARPSGRRRPVCHSAPLRAGAGAGAELRPGPRLTARTLRKCRSAFHTRCGGGGRRGEEEKPAQEQSWFSY